MSRFHSNDFLEHREIIPVGIYTSPLIHTRRFKQGGVQWGLADPPNGSAGGVVNPANVKLFGSMFPSAYSQDRRDTALPSTNYDKLGQAKIVENPDFWVPITWVAFDKLPNGVKEAGVLEITNTRGYCYLRLQWDVTTELNRFSLATSFLGD